MRMKRKVNRVVTKLYLIQVPSLSMEIARVKKIVNVVEQNENS